MHLKESTINIHTLTHNCHWAILISNHHHQIVSINSAFAKLFQLNIEHYINKDYLTLIHFLSQSFLYPNNFLQRTQNILQNQQIMIDEELLLKNYQMIRMDFNPLFSQNQYIGSFWQFHNISHRIESKKRQYSLMKDLEIANTDLSDFNYFVSHDLKSPLKTIHTLAHWIAQDSQKYFNKDGIQQVQLLLLSIQKIQSLVDGILQYTQKGRKAEKKIPVNLNQALQNLLQTYQIPQYIKIIIHPLPCIQLEITQILQVFDNLINNAIKYMNKPSGNIEVDCKENKNSYVFSVKDNGPGIDPEYQNKIFQFFHSLNQNQAIRNGMGLSIVRKIIEKWNGTIWLESKVNQGSQFFFSLPKIDV